jgi:hypothetical protein
MRDGIGRRAFADWARRTRRDDKGYVSYSRLAQVWRTGIGLEILNDSLFTAKTPRRRVRQEDLEVSLRVTFQQYQFLIISFSSLRLGVLAVKND